MKLYDFPLSGNCHKVRLLCALLGIPLEIVPVNLPQGEHRQADFLRLNPRGQVPVLDDAGSVIWDSMAILVYLGLKYGGASWLPQAPVAMAEVMQWLAVSENELLYGLSRARAVRKFNRQWDLPACQELGRQGLSILDNRLSRSQWLTSGQPTIADIACYPYVALAPEGDVPLDGYPHVLRWMADIRALPGYIGMPGIA